MLRTPRLVSHSEQLILSCTWQPWLSSNVTAFLLDQLTWPRGYPSDPPVTRLTPGYPFDPAVTRLSPGYPFDPAVTRLTWRLPVWFRRYRSDSAVTGLITPLPVWPCGYPSDPVRRDDGPLLLCSRSLKVQPACPSQCVNLPCLSLVTRMTSSRITILLLPLARLPTSLPSITSFTRLSDYQLYQIIRLPALPDYRSAKCVLATFPFWSK